MILIDQSLGEIFIEKKSLPLLTSWSGPGPDQRSFRALRSVLNEPVDKNVLLPFPLPLHIVALCPQNIQSTLQTGLHPLMLCDTIISAFKEEHY